MFHTEGVISLPVMASGSGTHFDLGRTKHIANCYKIIVLNIHSTAGDTLDFQLDGGTLRLQIVANDGSSLLNDWKYIKYI